MTESQALFLQSDWEITPALSLLSGVRMEHHNLVDQLIFSPRISFMYKPQSALQIRMTWSSGFRAPQAFDVDLHMTFAGGWHLKNFIGRRAQRRAFKQF